MSTRTILAASLRWHMRKGRRLVQLLVRWLRGPPPTHTGVSWG